MTGFGLVTPQELDIENDDADAFGGVQYSEGDAVMPAAEDEGEERLREAAVPSSARYDEMI